MRLADWDAATTAHVRDLWVLANQAHVEPVPPSPAAGGFLDDDEVEQPSEASPEERRRWRVLFALSRLLSTNPVVLAPEKVLREGVLAHGEQLGLPLDTLVWKHRRHRQFNHAALPPPSAEAQRVLWGKVTKSALAIESKPGRGPVARLAPFLEKLRTEPQPSEDTLATLWAEAVALILREPANPVPMRLLRHFDGEDNRNQAYGSFELPKRRGGTRTITTPTRSLKWLQRSALQVLTHLFPRHHCAVGFERRKGIVTHARAHAGKRWVYVLDLQDFFPSVTRNRVYGMLRAKPFGASEHVARYLANLVTHGGALPQGAPTSPVLANLVCRRMDARLFKWARERGYQYTRYADDLAFSTDRAEFSEADRQTIEEIVVSEGFRVHPDKKKLMPWYGRQLVTGLVVNRGANVPRETVRNLRALLRNVRKYGWESQIGRAQLHETAEAWALYKKRALPAAEFDKLKARQKKENLLVRPGTVVRKAQGRPADEARRVFQSVVRGRIEFVGAVKGKDSPVYRRLLTEYDALVGREQETAAAVRRGESAFVYEPAEVPAEAKGNYAEAKALIKRLSGQDATDTDLYEWIERRAEWSLEAEWLLKRFADLDAGERAKEVRTLAYSLDTHPAQTAAFFRQFANGRPFRLLLHDPMVQPDSDGRFHFGGGEPLSAQEIVGACTKAVKRFPLPNALKEETGKVLRACQLWLELHAHGHPFAAEGDEIRTRLQTYKWEVRYDDEPGLDLWNRLEAEVEALQERGGVVELADDLPPVFHTYTPGITGRKEGTASRPATAGALIRLLRSLVDKAIKKGKGGEVAPVRVSASYETVAGTEQAVVVLQAHDGPVGVAPGLRNVLRGDTQDVLHEVRGLARWTMEVPYPDGRVRAYDVTRNTEVDPVHASLPGFRHVLTFYQ